MKPLQHILDKIATLTRKKPSAAESTVKYNRICVEEFKKAYDYLHNSVHKNRPLGLYYHSSTNKDFIELVSIFNQKKTTDPRYPIFKNQLQMFVDRVKKEHFSVTLTVTQRTVTFDFTVK